MVNSQGGYRVGSKEVESWLRGGLESRNYPIDIHGYRYSASYLILETNLLPIRYVNTGGG